MGTQVEDEAKRGLWPKKEKPKVYVQGKENYAGKSCKMKTADDYVVRLERENRPRILPTLTHPCLQWIVLIVDSERSERTLQRRHKRHDLRKRPGKLYFPQKVAVVKGVSNC